LGYTVPEAVQSAVETQLRDLSMVYGGLGIAPVRARLCNLMSELCPGDINGFLFPSGGNEANEAAIRMARRYTGKHKIMSRYRSYHGGSSSTLSMTGDFRRWFAETGTSGFVKMFDPQPNTFSWGHDEETITKHTLAMLEEQIMYEGPNTIAAIFMESIPGAAGVLLPPAGYMQGVRALCDKYEILMVLDEVMVGFGRTGTMFGFQNFEGVLPDIVTFAKGISASYIPLSGVGMRQPIKEFFDENPLGWGTTYQAHPVAMACGYEVMKHLIKEDLVNHSKAMEPVMIEGLQMLVDNHTSIRQARAKGMFGCIDIVGEDGQLIQMLHEKPSDKFVQFRKKLLELGIFGLVRPPLFHCAPPLISTEAELREGFAKIDEAFKVLDF
jgi:adenosylmethionine-8-amino-7-oxononanoate aminotransferase